MSDIPRTKQELFDKLKQYRPRDYTREFGLDRDTSTQIHAFGRRHPEFLLNELLKLSGLTFNNEEDMVSAFYQALHMLSEDKTLRIKLQHSSLSKLF